MKQWTEQEIQKATEGMDAEQFEKFAGNLLRISEFLKNEQSRKLFFRQIKKVDKRLTALERQLRLGEFRCDAVQKSIQEGECDVEEEPVLWPSLQQIL